MKQDLNWIQPENNLKIFKTQIMINVIRFFTATAFIVCICTSGLKAQHSDFSGTWIRNTEKSDPGNLSLNSIPFSMTIKQTKKRIEITRDSKNGKGDSSSYTEKLSLDSSLSVTIIKTNLKKNSRMLWSSGKTDLHGYSEFVDESGNQVQTVTDTWILLDGRKTLQVNVNVTVHDQVYSMVELFDKQ